MARKKASKETEIKEEVKEDLDEELDAEGQSEDMLSEGDDDLDNIDDIEDMPADAEIEEEDVSDLSLALTDIDESGAVDDPVRMYLHEIGRVPLLTASDEKNLAQKMELGKRLQEVKASLQEATGVEPTESEVILEVLKEISETEDLVSKIQKELGIEPYNEFLKFYKDETIKQNIQGEFNLDFMNNLAASMETDINNAEQAVIKLSLNLALLPDVAIDNIDKKVTISGLKDKITEQDFIDLLKSREILFREDFKQILKDSEESQEHLIEANLRLVVSVAKKHIGRGMPLLDLLQEGNIGLIRAVEKFDYHRGFKFSTYATWWIRQAITRAIADQARTIRIPVHMVETINKLLSVGRQLSQELGREATPQEIGEQMDLPAEKVREIIKVSQLPISLESPIGEEEDSHLGDFLEDQNAAAPPDVAARQLLREQIDSILNSLSPREKRVLTMRFGLEDGRSRTLEEVGKEFNVTRERIRQIEAKALRKLRHPTRSKKLKDYLE